MRIVSDMELARETKSGMVQGEIQSLRKEVFKEKVSRSHDQRFINEYVEQVKRD